MSGFRWITIAAGVAAAGGAVFAQDVVVAKSGGEKSTIDWAAFGSPASGAGATAVSVAKADLDRSGWFRVVAGAGEFRVSGSVSEAGGQLSAQCLVVHAARGAQVLGKTYTASGSEARTLAHRIADDIVKAVTGREGYASSRIVLVGSRTGKKELYLCDSDGANLIQLTNDRSLSLYPRWGGSNNEFITYTGYFRGFPGAYRIQLAGGRRDQLAGYAGLNAGAVMSPDGRSVAVILSRDGNPELYVQTPPGGAPTRITQTLKAAESSPSWSPDGREICYVSDVSGRPQLYIVSRSGGSPRRVTSRGTENVAPNWGANGTIAFASRLGSRFQISVLDPKTLAVVPYAFDDADYEDPSWARNGRHIICVRSSGSHRSLCLIDTMGGERLTLELDRGDWFSPSFSK